MEGRSIVFMNGDRLYLFVTLALALSTTFALFLHSLTLCRRLERAQRRLKAR